MTGQELTRALLEAAAASFSEFTESLALEAPKVVGSVKDLPNGSGAMIPLVGTANFQLGLFGEGDACVELAKGVLGTEDAPDPNDVADAVCEAVNVVAGAAKVKLAAIDKCELKLGLPLFMTGRTHPFREVSIAGLEIMVQSRKLTLVVIAG